MAKAMRFAVICQFVFLFCCVVVSGQNQALMIGWCGEMWYYDVPPFPDNDADGMSDELEEALLEYLGPSILQHSGDSCPGSNPFTGWDIPNLVTCRVQYYPPQWRSVYSYPVLNPGYYSSYPRDNWTWENGDVFIRCAVLYGKDCGTAGHTADIEPFFFTAIRDGGASVAWRYDTNMANWRGGWIETIAHQGTSFEKREDGPFQNPNIPSYTSLISAKNKHGNYLTLSGCAWYDTCSPGSTKYLSYLNVGEEWSPLITDLGAYVDEYTGENPWSGQTFLGAFGGGAGSIRDKLGFMDTTVFPGPIGNGNHMTCDDMCYWYLECRGCAYDLQAALDDCQAACNTGQPSRWRCRPTFPR